MGRRMRPVDPAAGPVERFACELRDLRATAGDPPFWKMARRCTVSKSALAAAVAGQHLPSERVLRQFAEVCGGDWGWWRDRLQQARAELQSRPVARHPAQARPEAVVQMPAHPAMSASGPLPRGLAETAPLPPAVQRTARRPTRPGKRRSAAALLGAAALAAAAVAGVTVSVNWPHAAPSSRPVIPARATPSRVPGPSLPVNDGDDPRVDGCASADDAEQAALGSIANPFVPIIGAGGQVIGDLGIWHNARCGASWAEASYRNPGLFRTTISLHRPADGAAVVTEVTANLPYDPVIGRLLLDGNGCVWADIKVEIPGAAPITAKTPCEV